MLLKFLKYIFLFALFLGLFTGVFAQQGESDSLRNDTVAWYMPPDSIVAAAADSLAANDTIQGEKKQKTAIDKPISYKATDSIRFSVDEKMVYMYNGGVVDYDDINLKADYVNFNFENNEVYAEGVPDSTGKKQGEPEFKQGNQNFSSKVIRYNFETRRGLIKEVVTEQSGGYLHGEVTKRHEDGEIHIMHGKYTTCNHKHPHFYIGLSKAKVIPDDKIVSGPLYMVIADIPTPVILPFGFFPNQKGGHSGILIPAYGEERERGFYLRGGGYYFKFSDYMDFSLVGDIYSKGSWGLNAHSNYKLRYKFSGNFDVRYNSNVTGDKADPESYSKNTSYWIKWSHRQDPKARPNSTFSANVNFGSSSFHSFNTTNLNDYLSSTFSSSVSYSKRWPTSPFNFSANLTHSQNTQTKVMNLSLPVVAFSMTRIFPFQKKKRVGKPKWYEKISVSYSANTQNKVSAPDSLVFTPQAPFDFGFKHSIPVSASYKFLKFFSFTPSINYDGVLYASSIRKQWVEDVLYPTGLDTVYGRVEVDTVSGMSYAHSLRSSVAFRFAPKLYGMYQARNQKEAKIPVMRHVIMPEVSLSYVPSGGLSTDEYYREYQSDAGGTMREYSIFDGYMYGTPRDSRESGNINFSLNNTLELKVRDENDTTAELRKVKLLEGLSFRTSYNIFADSLNWSKITMSGRTKLFNLFNINFGGRFNWYAVDSLGNTTNQFWYKETGKLFRFESFNFDFGYSFNSKTLGKKTEEERKNQPVGDYYHGIYYGDFSMPWDFRFDYSFDIYKRFNRLTQQFESDISQNLRFSGHISFTEKWKISFTSGYDFDAKKLSTTSVNIYRDLHCWEMSFNWIPFGRRQSYMFQINVKASVFKDVKYSKQKSWYDAF